MKLASIETVSEILPHPNADKLEIAKVLGWQSVVRKGEFKTGDTVVFVVIDTILPVAPWSEFLKKGDKQIRLKTAKIRGQYSQGLVLPMSVLPDCTKQWHMGSDVGCELGIKKYEKEVPLALSGVVKGTFPQHLAPRTDEDNGLSNPDLVAEVLKYPIRVTVKLDGSSCTVIVRDGKIDQVCSRNQSLMESDSNAFWAAAKKLELPVGDWVIQGELMGPGIQGNQLGLTSPELFVYQVRKIDGTWITDPYKFPFDCRSVWTLVNPYETPTLERLQGLADEVVLSPREGILIPAEGIVVRPVNPITAGNGRPLSFKIINRNYAD